MDNSKIDRWAQEPLRLSATERPSQALNLNVEGRQVCGPFQGFGPLWRKRYWANLGRDVQPEEVIDQWKKHFPKFWPAGNYFYSPPGGVAPGHVVIINLSAPGGLPLSTGVLIIYADPVSFSLITIEGHMFSGLNNFSAYKQDGNTVAEVQALIRTNDPIWEFFMRAVGFKKEDEFWKQTLRSLAGHFGVRAEPEFRAECLDRHLQWSKILNIRHNAAILSTAYVLLTGWKRMFSKMSRGEGR